MLTLKKRLDTKDGSQSPIIVLFTDLDWLKLINDAMNHAQSQAKGLAHHHKIRAMQTHSLVHM